MDSSFTGLYDQGNITWYVNSGRINRNYNDVVMIGNDMYYISKGKVDYSYSGVGKNSEGWWYIKNGKVDWTYSGLVTYQGEEYVVVKGYVKH